MERLSSRQSDRKRRANRSIGMKTSNGSSRDWQRRLSPPPEMRSVSLKIRTGARKIRQCIVEELLNAGSNAQLLLNGISCEISPFDLGYAEAHSMRLGIFLLVDFRLEGLRDFKGVGCSSLTMSDAPRYPCLPPEAQTAVLYVLGLLKTELDVVQILMGSRGLTDFRPAMIR